MAKIWWVGSWERVAEPHRELASSRNHPDLKLRFFSLIFGSFRASSDASVSYRELAHSKFSTLGFTKPADLWNYRKREFTVNWGFCIWRMRFINHIFSVAFVPQSSLLRAAFQRIFLLAWMIILIISIWRISIIVVCITILIGGR